MNTSKRLLTVAEFCNLYSVSRTTVHYERKAGRLKAVKIGVKALIPMEAAEEWAKALPAGRQAA